MKKDITPILDKINLNSTSEFIEIKKDLKSQEQKYIDSTNECITSIKELKSDLTSQMQQDRDFMDDMYKIQSKRYELLNKKIDKLEISCLESLLVITREQYRIEKNILNIEHRLSKYIISVDKKLVYIMISILILFVSFVLIDLYFNG